MNSRNIPLLYLIKACKWLMLYMPILFLYYQENDLGKEEFFLLHAIYSLVVAIMEVPSGFIADSWGRKPSMILGTAFGFIGFTLYSMTHGFWGFLIAELALGIGGSFISGSDSALLYDTLLEKKKEKKYLKIEARITATGNFAEMFAGLIVSVLAFTVYRNYLVIQCLLAGLAFLASLILIEPKTHLEKPRLTFPALINIIGYTFKEHNLLRKYIILSSIIGFASLTMAWSAQIIFKEVGLKESHYGNAWFILNGLVGIGSLISSWMHKKMSLKAVLWTLSLVLSIGFVLNGLFMHLWALVFLVPFYIIRGTAHPILKKHINDLSPSDKRATIMSLRSLFIRISFSILAPLIIYISGKISLSYALILCGIAILVPASIFVIQILASKRKE